MISFKKFELANGLRFIVNTDTHTPFVVVNTLYNVGSKHELPEKTGFAHLFEHLMFGGSKNIPSFDEPLQKVGGDNNAFTNSDITNYYITVPKENIETAFWLESDRMLELDFSQKSLDIQKNVVVEEFKQRYLNRPYGDAWLYLRPLAYKNHPYQWATIGKKIEHIQEATLQDVKDFFFHHYAPNNAIISISGNISVKKARRLAQKWFGSIPYRTISTIKHDREEEQTEKRTQTLEQDVPLHAIYKAYHMCERSHPDFHAIDLLSDILSNGKSSRMYNNLVQKQKIFSDIQAFITGEDDPGLFIVTGTVMPGFTIEQANKAIESELQSIQKTPIHEYELQKVKNKVESTLIFSESSILNKAMNLAKYELLGDAGLINRETEKYACVTIEDIQRVAQFVFSETNESTLLYQSTLQA
ncbi:MAG: M16 family metallopeptidase [Bacteroidota bacterium]